MEHDADKILKNIAKNGCHIIHVPADETHPCFTYSIGIEQSRHRPEVIVTGLEKDMAHFLINEYNSRILDGEIFDADQFYDDFLEDFQITFKAIDKKHYQKYFEYGLWLYKGNEFNALHFIWPDTNGAWPWEKKASKEYRGVMPPLYAR